MLGSSTQDQAHDVLVHTNKADQAIHQKPHFDAFNQPQTADISADTGLYRMMYSGSKSLHDVADKNVFFNDLIKGQ